MAIVGGDHIWYKATSSVSIQLAILCSSKDCLVTASFFDFPVLMRGFRDHQTTSNHAFPTRSTCGEGGQWRRFASRDEGWEGWKAVMQKVDQIFIYSPWFVMWTKSRGWKFQLGVRVPWGWRVEVESYLWAWFWYLILCMYRARSRFKFNRICISQWKWITVKNLHYLSLCKP